MADRIQIRRDTSTAWTTINPILAQGELGFELDTQKLKIGDSLTAWNDLPYAFVGIDDHLLLSNIGTNSHSDIDSHIASTSNPHLVTKTQVGLSNVDNTSDLNKPISTDTQTALNLKYDASNPDGFQTALEVSSSIATAIGDHESEADPHPQYETATEVQTKVDAHANLINNPHSVTAAQVGLGNVDNTSDLNKPISTATQGALDLKYDANNPNGYETLAQLDARDIANRSRANHTGSQLASTISDFENAVKEFYNPRFRSYFFDDFIASVNASLQWQVVTSGTGSSTQLEAIGTNTTDKAFGVRVLDTGTTATGRTSLSLNNGFILLGYHSFDLSFRIQIGNIGNLTDNFVIYIGLHDNIASGAPTDGVYFVYAASLGPNWLCITRSANIQTTVDSGVAADTNFNILRVFVAEDASLAQFYINDALVASSTTNIPSGSGRQTGICAKIEKLSGTVQMNIALDFYEHMVEYSGGRY